MSLKSSSNVRVLPVLRNYFQAVMKYPVLLGTTITSIVGVEIADVIAPLYIKEILDHISTGVRDTSSVHAIFIAVGLFALITFASWIFKRVRDFTGSYAQAKVMRNLYENAFQKLLRHSQEFFISNFTGTLTRRVTRYARVFEVIMDNILYDFIPAVIFSIGVIGILMMRSVLLGTIVLVWIIAFVYLQYVLVNRFQHLRVENNKADSHMSGFLSDSIVNHATITDFAALSRESKTFGESVTNWYKTLIRAWNADNFVTAAQGLFVVIIEIGILIVAVLLWQRGVITVGDFVLIQIYIFGLIGRIFNIGNSMRGVYDAFAEATEMLDIIELPLEILDNSVAKKIIVSDGNIVFDHVYFGYDKNRYVLKDFDIQITAHEKVALVGLSGAGKSTITKLLLRLYDIQKGSIRIDGQSISSVTQESLRRAISIVPQEPMLFHRTLMENIRYGRPDATEADVFRVAEQAHCTEFISEYPDKFETLVGERGVKLSGGERQRIAIARALLKNAPILVLDEATSSLDSESEELIQKALITLMEGKTVIAVAHRLSTIMKMDRIIVMEHGNVTLSGTHDELLSKENLYNKLWGIQAGGFTA